VLPIPSWDLEKAKEKILSWVRTEHIPKNEWERLKSGDPNDPEHNLHAVYAINYALKIAGAVPGRSYTAQQSERISEIALWILIKDLRQIDQRTCQSLFLRDAQRYLYGTLGEAWPRGDAWPRKYIHDKFEVAGGEAWYNLGLARFKEMHLEKGPPKADDPLLKRVPDF
jgi:hypothetical protein